MTFALDHVVINAVFEMDRAAKLMSQLGFTVTPRGYHSLGSINHLIMFEGHYLELIGLPMGTDGLRQDILRSPKGLNGLVFQAGDADACRDVLRASGLAALEPQNFSRPVEIGGVEQLCPLPHGPDRAGAFRGGAGLLLPALYAGTGLASPVDVPSQWLPRSQRAGRGKRGTAEEFRAFCQGGAGERKRTGQ